MAGLKHFDDMQQRISRAEVEQVHGIVFKAVSELLKVESQPDADRLHCRVTGSYIRGKPMTGMNSNAIGTPMHETRGSQHRTDIFTLSYLLNLCAQPQSDICQTE